VETLSTPSPAGAPGAGSPVPLRPCLTCGTLTRKGSYCPRHAHQGSRAWQTPPPGWAALRTQTLLRDGQRCVLCGSTTNPAVHHIIPRAHGGPDTPDNLATLCQRCHRRAHGGTGPPAAA
jgi:5-methylcytosine-specific restriction endonuclease McrA